MFKLTIPFFIINVNIYCNIINFGRIMQIMYFIVFFGESAFTAVCRFQKEYSLSMGGIADVNTLNTLNKYLSNNTNSFGICIQGNYMTEIMSECQKNLVINFCKPLCSKYPITKIKGHKELTDTDYPHH